MQKQMRTGRPGRKSAPGTVKGGDALKARLLELCDLAEASIAELRAMDLETATSEDFKKAVGGLNDAGYFVQGFDGLLEARAKIKDAAEALRVLAIDDDPDDLASWSPGLLKRMLAEARTRFAEVTA